MALVGLSELPSLFLIDSLLLPVEKKILFSHLKIWFLVIKQTMAVVAVILKMPGLIFKLMELQLMIVHLMNHKMVQLKLVQQNAKMAQIKRNSNVKRTQ